MKRTKSMIYNPTEESNELFLVATNDGRLYKSLILPILHNLQRYYRKGVFNKEKAIDAFYPVATAASDQYFKDFGYRFSVQDRFTAAADMLDNYLEDIESDVYNY